MRQGLGGDAVAGLGPLGLPERAIGFDRYWFTLDVDLGGLFPAAAHGLVGDPRVVRGHLAGLVIKKYLHDLLRDVPVDQPAGEGVPPLMGCQVGGFTVLVTDVAVGQPAVEHASVAVVGQRALPVGVAVLVREQVPVRCGQASGDALLVGADLGFEFGVDRDSGLAVHLVVEVAKVGSALAVVDQAGERQGAGVAGA